jgi:pimeloyl-ACP methyl ester carboxylesterase
VNWALDVAKVTPERIAIIGHSLGTAVASAVVEKFAKNGTEFAGLILIAGFTNLPSLLTSYSIAGFLPLLSPLRKPAMLQKWCMSFVIDRWHSAARLASFVRASKKVRLFIIHAKNDFDIPYVQSDGLFLAAANATTSLGMDSHLISKMTARNTIDMGEGAFIRTWKADENKIIREQIVSDGGELSHASSFQRNAENQRPQPSYNICSCCFSSFERIWP